MQVKNQNRESLSEVSGIILAGGKSSRMGTEKALIEYGAQRLIDTALKVFRELFPEIIIVANAPCDYLDQDTVVVTDIFPGKGPLGGIYTGLFFASNEYAFVAACDMPFLDPAFIRYMTSLINGYDIVVPRSSSGSEPLHAVYSRKCLNRISSLLGSGELKITGFYKGMRTRWIEAEDCLRFGAGEKMFFNINSPQDFKNI